MTTCHSHPCRVYLPLLPYPSPIPMRWCMLVAFALIMSGSTASREGNGISPTPIFTGNLVEVVASGSRCRFHLFMDMEVVPLVSLSPLMDEAEQCLDQNTPKADGVYTGTQTLKLPNPLVRHGMMWAPYELNCTHHDVRDSYYFYLDSHFRLGVAIAKSRPDTTDDDWDADVRALIRGMCMHLKMTKRRILARLKRQTQLDRLRALVIDRKAEAFARIAAGALGIQRDASVLVTEDSRSTTVSAGDGVCIVKIYHGGATGDRFSKYISAALGRSFGGACLTPVTIGSPPVDFEMELIPQDPADMVLVTCRTVTEPVDVVGTYTFWMDSVPALMGAPLRDGIYELEGDTEEAAGKLCASVAAMREHVYDMRN